MVESKRRCIRAIKCLFLICAITLGHGTAHAAGFTVIANKTVPDSSLSKSELQAIYLGDKVRWDNKKYIKISVLEEEKALKEFLHFVVGRTPSQFDQHWVRLVTTGRGSMPPVFPDAQQIVDYVSKTPNAIGFVGSGQATDTVKTISVK